MILIFSLLHPVPLHPARLLGDCSAQDVSFVMELKTHNETGLGGVAYTSALLRKGSSLLDAI